MSNILTLYSTGYIKNIASFSTNNLNFQIFSEKYFLHFNSFENILENVTFAPPPKILHFKGIQLRLNFTQDFCQLKHIYINSVWPAFYVRVLNRNESLKGLFHKDSSI